MIPTIRSSHGNLSYVQSGTGRQTVTLLHGLYCCKEFWEGYLPLLPPDCRAIAPDLLGHGASDEGRRHGIPEQVAAVRALLDRLGVENTALCGHSMGGVVALAFALAYPDRVERLLLAMTPFTERGIALPLRALRLPLLSLAAHALNRSYFRAQVRSDGDKIWSLMLRPSLRTIVESARGLKAFERGGGLRNAAELPMPIACLHGSRDKVLGRRQLDAARVFLPQAAHDIVPDSGHAYPNGDEENFACVANPFLLGVEIGVRR
jgi:pimeloyl-ACP methyl ester carboxylesterase